MQSYPISLIGLGERCVIVIGGGAVAARKVQGLLDAGATPKVIAPQLCGALAALAEAGKIEWEQRLYRAGDLGGGFLAIAATGDREANAAVSREAAICGCLVNVVDDPALSSFILPAVVRRGELTVALSTGGASPALARRLRERLEAEIGPEYGALAALLAEMRPELHVRFASPEARLAAALLLIDADLGALIRDQGYDAAAGRARALLDGTQQ